MSQPVLVYDGSNRWFRAVGEMLADRSEDLVLVPWRAEGVQAFLEAQFGGRPFAFVMVELDEDTVHVGGETVERLLRDQGLPEPTVALLKRLYPAVSDPLGRLLHGREPADIDGSFPVAEEARPHIETLRRSCSLPACAR